MATARKSSSGKSGKPKPASKPAAKGKPAAKSAARAKPTAKPSVRPAAKKGRLSPVKHAAKAVAKPTPHKAAASKPAAKGASPKASAGKAALAKGAPLAKGAAPAKGGAKGPAKAIAPAKPAPKPIGRLVPARPMPPGKGAPVPAKGGKTKAPRPAPEVRPLGVLPPESMAKPRNVLPVRPVAPRPAPAPVKPPAPKKGEDRLNEKDIQYFEHRLREERAKIMKEMGHLESTILKVNPRDSAGDLSGYSFHMADAGTDAMEREISFDIASKEGRLLREIDDALRRVYNGTYGVCEASGKPIARARLEALPWARYTVEEQEKIEKEQRAGRLAVPE